MLLSTVFRDTFGEGHHQIRVFQAPGRVNLIGEHIDYNGGHVFPAALSMGSTVYAGQRRDRMLRIFATDLQRMVIADLDQLDAYRSLPWGNYQLGVADELQKAGYELSGCDLLFEDKVPLKSGLSSSAAIEVVTVLALLAMSGHPPLDPVEAALLAQRAEHRYVGVFCGIMDQFASAMGKRGHAILLDTRTLAYRHVPVNLTGYRMIIANTNKRRSLGESAYNIRRMECTEALVALQKRYPEIRNLCDLTSAQLEESKSIIPGENLWKRAMHAVSENQRVLNGVAALTKGDLAGFGSCMDQSHASLRNNYEVSCRELDLMVELARDCSGTAGSRMTGAGFGGCTVSIVEENQVETFMERVGQGYQKATGLPASFYLSDIADGAGEVKDECLYS